MKMDLKIMAVVVLFLAGVAVFAESFVKVQQAAETIAAPQVLTVTTSPQTVFAVNPSRTTGRVLMRTIQNTGTVPVLYCINGTVSTGNYHGVLAAGSVARDGLGSVLDLSRISFPVTIATESGSGTVAVVELTQ